ncbi:ankyrin repeat domain-containing protein [Actinoallomurus spadix]|uniref:ankyrin repeat domain-containing protein n=1 Tax=Actinoallomurus spadix TaxID=79912 RepID=UPI002092872D|nr:ankyrin repeat domain-containing protein [Actinoallomurus spadix]MCO5988076.1 ankyrin repeat domain-containing protein [Actinoallomurus spadix]
MSSAAAPGLPPRPPSRSHPPHEAARLRRIRRYAVPRWMIEQATERRLAGDWRGACAAANVDVAFDLAAVADAYGDAVAAELEDDLLHFAPDLRRWHLPRLGRGRTTIVPDQAIILSHPGLPPERLPSAHRSLFVRTPRWRVNGPQRLVLDFGNPHPVGAAFLDTDVTYCPFWHNLVQRWSTARHLWDVRHAGELRERCGGDADRAPFFEADGTPKALPAAAPGRADPAAHTEWVTLLHESGRVAAAFAAAGIGLDADPVEVDPYFSVKEVLPLDVFERLPLALTRLEAEIRDLAERTGRDRFWVPYTQYAAVIFEAGASEVRARVIPTETAARPDGAEVLPEACWRRLPDLDLLRDGGTPPERLHPLVREALFPGRAAADGPVGPPGPEPPVPVRVRCRDAWHEVASRGGALDIPHDEEEQRRESAMRAFGGAIAGCFAVRETWTSGAGRLPKALRAQRRELFSRAEHGDAPGVLALLDAGVDPRVRDGRRRTLLHLLHLLDPGVDVRGAGPERRELLHRLRLLDHDGLLARLLAAGVDIDARDEQGRTPLFAAICGGGSPALVRALLAAGARIDLKGEIHEEEVSIYRLLDLADRDDLSFLAEWIERERPELTEW